MSRAGKSPAVGELLRDFRGALANLRAAAEALEQHGQGERSAPESALVTVVAEEARRLSDLVTRLDHELAPPRPRRPRSLGEFLTELAALARRDLDLDLDLPAVPAELRLRGDGRELAAALLAVLGQLRRDFAVTRLETSLREREGLAVLDLRWSAAAPELARLGLAHGELLDGTSPPLRATAQAADGEAWLTVDRTHQAATLHCIVPVS